MRRALDLARKGLANTSPNPHVGAVIAAPDGRIIGEGWHRKCGMAHAEVNAIGSVAAEDRPLLEKSTIYVTLEPCSHYGKTPPCAELIVRTGIPDIVVGVTDPNPKVNGNGIRILREAGRNVTESSAEDSAMCLEADPVFFSRYRTGRPYITLKWARSRDGYMAAADGGRVRLSTPLTSTLVHKLRAEHDVILTSSATVIADNPLLDTRLWAAGRNPAKAVMVRNRQIPEGSRIFAEGETVILGSDPGEAVKELGRRGYGSILVEAGPTLLDAFVRAGLYDAIRVETAAVVLGDGGSCKAPSVPPDAVAVSQKEIDGNLIEVYRREIRES